MNDINNSILNAVETMVDAKLNARGTTTYSMGKVTGIHEMGHVCMVETPTGSFQVNIPREFDGLEEDSMIIFKDLFGDHQRLYVDSVLSGDWTGGGGPGGGKGGGFRVVKIDLNGREEQVSL